MFITAHTSELFTVKHTYKPKKHWSDPHVIESITAKWNKDFLDAVNEDDTYVLVFTKGEHYEYVYNWFIKQPQVKILYQSPPAINTRYSNTELRNFVVVFEWQKPVRARSAVKTEKTQEETTLSPLTMEEAIVSPVATIEMPNTPEVFKPLWPQSQVMPPVGEW